MRPDIGEKLMESSGNNYQVLLDYLAERGHDDQEIQTIMARVHDYDEKTQHDSIMDSIGSGGMDLEALVREALGD